jgi:hypothetical protein
MPNLSRQFTYILNNRNVIQSDWTDGSVTYADGGPVQKGTPDYTLVDPGTSTPADLLARYPNLRWPFVVGQATAPIVNACAQCATGQNTGACAGCAPGTPPGYVTTGQGPPISTASGLPFGFRPTSPVSIVGITLPAWIWGAGLAAGYFALRGGRRR